MLRATITASRAAELRGAVYGNVILSRFPVREVRVYDLTASRREARGCIRCDLEIAPGKIVHLFNVHLGTGYMERRKQARLLMSRRSCCHRSSRPRLIIGDFKSGRAALFPSRCSIRLRASIFSCTQSQAHYPGVLPIMHPDHMYFDRDLALEEFLSPQPMALLASDHLPLVAEFRLDGR